MIKSKAEADQTSLKVSAKRSKSKVSLEKWVKDKDKFELNKRNDSRESNQTKKSEAKGTSRGSSEVRHDVNSVRIVYQKWRFRNKANYYSQVITDNYPNMHVSVTKNTKIPNLLEVNVNGQCVHTNKRIEEAPIDTSEREAFMEKVKKAAA